MQPGHQRKSRCVHAHRHVQLSRSCTLCPLQSLPPRVGPCSQVDNMQPGKDNSGPRDMRLVELVVS